MSYTQLTREQRYQIYALMKAGQSQTHIGQILAAIKAPSLAKCAATEADVGTVPSKHTNWQRRATFAAYRPRITRATWGLVESLLWQEWSPEQTAGRFNLEQQPPLSHERIYQYVYADQRRGGTIHQHLRCRKKRRKRYGINSRRGQNPHRVSIDHRPQVVDAKRRIGDWEADTIIGQTHRQAIVSLTQRKSKLTLLQKVERKTAEAVTAASLEQLSPLAARVQTITSDNVLPTKASLPQRQVSPAQDDSCFQ